MKVKVLKVLMATLFAFVCTSSMAQVLNDLNGRPMITKGYGEVKGSPYLSDEWLTGTAKLTTGVSYKDNLYLKYNLMEDELYFKGKNEEPLLFVVPVNDFTINYKGSIKHYKNGFNIDGYNSDSFFEILADGSAQLLKKTKKVILENKQYNSPTIDKSFEDVNQYFIVQNGKATLVKKDKKSVLNALGAKQPELETYIKSNNLNLKNDADFAKLIIYYNSI